MFLKRLGYFMIGLSIGLVFLTFFLKKKSDETGVSFCYFPNCRVLKNLRSKPILYSNAVSERLQNTALDTLTINRFFTDGEVNFGASDTKAKPCKKYQIEYEINDVLSTLYVNNCNDKVIVTDIKP